MYLHIQHIFIAMQGYLCTYTDSMAVIKVLTSQWQQEREMNFYDSIPRNLHQSCKTTSSFRNVVSTNIRGQL